MNIFKKISVLIILFLFGCSGNKIDPVTGKAETFEPNANERAKKYVEENPITLFGKDKKDNTIVNFGTSNVLWRAAIKSLDFLPLTSIDYNGGIIISDWYNENASSNDQIKIQINFLSNDIKSESIIVIAHKKTCDTTGNCKIKKLENDFSSSVKESILNSARLIKIEDTKKK
jgi:hypothetical protein